MSSCGMDGSKGLKRGVGESQRGCLVLRAAGGGEDGVRSAERDEVRGRHVKSRLEVELAGLCPRGRVLV